jgi:hypothetical protein
MGNDGVEDGVWFDCIFIVDLVVQSSFAVYVESLHRVHKVTLSGCV